MLNNLTVTARDFDILQEILLRVHAQGWRIREVPFHYTARGAGRSHARIVAFGWAYLTTLLRMWRLRNSVAAADYDHRAFDSLIPLQRYWQRARHRITLGFVRAADPVAPGPDPGHRVWVQPDHPRSARRHRAGYPVAEVALPARPPSAIGPGTVFALPFPAEQFDIVICSEVIEHIAATPQVFHELTRVLRPGGTLILGTPDYGRRLWWILEWVYGKVLPGAYAHEHITHYTRADLARRLTESGCTVEDLQYVGFCEMIFRARKTEA